MSKQERRGAAQGAYERHAQSMHELRIGRPPPSRPWLPTLLALLVAAVLGIGTGFIEGKSYACPAPAAQAPSAPSMAQSPR